MSAVKAPPSPRRPLAFIALLLLLCPPGYMLGTYVSAAVGAAGAGAPRRAFLERPDPKHTRCIEATEYMRYHHMDLIKELRDAGVRGGALRKTSLASCRRCHTSRVRFCDRCHAAVNLTPDCFDCHYYP